LNQLACYMSETRPDSLNDTTFFEELCSLSVELLRDEHPAIRAMCFRLLRICLFTERNLIFILTTNADIYALIFAMILVYQQSHLKRLIEFSAAQQDGKKYAFPKSVMQPVIALALRAVCSKLRLSVACLEVFLEFCVLEPDLVLDMAGTDWMVRILTGESGISRRIAAVVARILVAWLDQPKLRAKGKLHLVLEQIFAPLIEFGFFQKNLSSTEQGERIVEAAMNNFSHSFLCILRSWSGLFACAAIGPNSTVIASSPFRLLEYLGLGTVDNSNLSRIRDMIVDICCDFLDLPYASIKFDSWTHALNFYSSITVPDEFSSSLKDDFVLAQSEMCIASDKDLVRHVDLLTSFQSLAGFILINAGLLQSLARLIVAQPDSSSGIKATLFVTDVLRTATAVLPSGWRATILSTPTLVQSACESLAQSKAAAAIHGYYDPNHTDRFTFPNSGYADGSLRAANLDHPSLQERGDDPSSLRYAEQSLDCKLFDRAHRRLSLLTIPMSC
uniref:RICTOR_N domain-containing protein n=1 Tax=Heligmosomoides polygyrus TaxID=6339 RepID=A0A183GKW7_HELPZ